MLKVLTFCFLFITGIVNAVFAQKPDNPLIWEKAMEKFAQADLKNMPPEEAVVFTGSSSIRGWRTLDEDFPELKTINRGFGGSRIGDATYYFEQVIGKYKPEKVVLYSGDNDVASGKNADMVFDRFKEFARKMKAELPDTELYFLSIKPSLARWSMYDEMKEANKKIKRYAYWHKNVIFVDVSSPMIGEDGKPRPELYIGDGLHMTREGYNLWTKVLRPYIVD